VFLVASFALGLVVISRAPGYAGSLQQFLFGSITGIPARDVLITAIASVGVLSVVAVLHRQLVTMSLDREMARAMGLATFRLDLVLYVCVTLAVVVSLQTVGNILVLALLVTPAATARLLTDRLAVMMTVAPLIGAASAVTGIYLSWSYDLPVGATIVLVLAAVFVVVWAVAPRHGVLRRRRSASRDREPDGQYGSV
jgi:manganese/iron transport system permease protein